MEKHYSVKLHELNTVYAYRQSIHQRDGCTYVETLQLDLQHIMNLRDLMKSLPWEDQVEFCRISGHSEALLIWLDEEQRIAYRIVS